MRMKTFLFKSLYLTCFFSTFSSLAESSNIDFSGPTSVEFKAAYFRPSNDFVKEIYSNGWVDYGFEFSKMITTDNNLAIWGGVNWYRTKGHAACCGDIIVSKSKTSISVVPFSLGLKYFMPVPQVYNANLYLGAGISTAFVRIKDDSEFVKAKLSKNGAFGWVLKSGIQYFFRNNVFIDVFADYVFQEVNFKRGNGNVANFSASLDGLKLGVGLGLNF